MPQTDEISFLIQCEDCGADFSFEDTTQCANLERVCNNRFCNDCAVVNPCDHDSRTCDDHYQTCDCGCARDYCACLMTECVDSEGQWHHYDHECSCEEDSEEISGLHQYSYKPIWSFHRHADDYSPHYLGVELEFEAESNRDIARAVEATTSQSILWKHDGSLLKGAELVTHPATLRHHIEELDWENILDQVSYSGLRPDTSCGMHIHASRPGTFREINRLMTMLIDYEMELCLVSQRRSDDLNRWARWNSHGWETSKQQTFECHDDWLALMRHCRSRGRYVALNMEPPDTVEFRFFAGTDDADQVLARLALVSHMMDISRGHYPLPDWGQFMKGLNSQVASKLEKDIVSNHNKYALSPYNCGVSPASLESPG